MLHTPLPDLESLRCFDAAATRLNFRVAAGVVHLSPAAFSDRIRRLEDTLGQPLFARSTRRVALTPAGLRLLPVARRVLEEARRCAAAVQAADAPVPLDLVLGTRFELGLSWLTPALPDLARRQPERTLHLYFGDSDDLLTRLHRGTVDAVVTSARLHQAGLEYALLHPETYVMVGAPALLRAQPLRRAEDARQHTLLDAHADLPLFRYFQDACPPEEVWAFQRIHRLGTIGAVRQMCLRGGGVAVLPEYLVGPDIRARALRRLMPHVGIHSDHFRLIWRVGHAHAAALRALAESLRSMPLR